jgi:hypothetical protein
MASRDGDDMNSTMDSGLRTGLTASIASAPALERDPRTLVGGRTARPPAPRRRVTHQHAFVTILFLVVCMLDCVAVATLPADLVNRVVGPALTLTWIAALLTFGVTRWRAGRR